MVEGDRWKNYPMLKTRKEGLALADYFLGAMFLLLCIVTIVSRSA